MRGSLPRGEAVSSSISMVELLLDSLIKSVLWVLVYTFK